MQRENEIAAELHEAQRLVATLAKGRRRAIYRRIAFTAAGVIVLGVLALLWWRTPLREWIDLRRIADSAANLRAAPFAPLLMLAAFVIGGLVLFPVNALIAISVLVFGPLFGAAYALIGCEASAWLLYEIGRHLPASGLRQRIDKAMQRFKPKLRGHRLLAVIVVRIVPVAPYGIVNLAAGAAHISRAQYLAGTALGMLPGILINALFVDRVIAAVEHPTPRSYALLLVVVAAIVALIALIRHRIAQARAA